MKRKLQVAEMFRSRIPSGVLTEQDGYVYYIRYNAETDKIEIGSPTNTAFLSIVEIVYNHEVGLDANLEDAYAALQDYLATEEKQGGNDEKISPEKD